MDIQEKFQQREGRVFLTGMEAIVRLVLEKQWCDMVSGHINQTYFTGYEGSPLGGLDLKRLIGKGVRFTSSALMKKPLPPPF